MTIATTEIAMPVAAKVDVGGTVPVLSSMWSTTTMAIRPRTPAAPIHKTETMANLGFCVRRSGRSRRGGIPSSIAGRYRRALDRSKGRLPRMTAGQERNVAQLLVECLENEGVEYVFGLPGKRTST